MCDLLILFLFPALMVYAAVSDLLTMTLANWISLVLVGGFLALSAMLGTGWQALLVDHLSCGLAVLVATFALFARGWIGGGDAKLAAATALWFGWGQLADYGLVTSLIGGALTLAILALRRQPLPRLLSEARWIARLHDAESGVPYGIALAAAGLLLYPQTSVWTSAL